MSQRSRRGTFTDTGVFVCFEGGEGPASRPSRRALGAWLTDAGYVVLLTFEPGDTPVGKQLREIVLGPATGELSPRTEALLYAADKAEHVDTLVRPALDRGEVVITDRYVDSSLAYQGAGRVLDLAELTGLPRWATDDLRPHLTVVLDVDPSTAWAGSRGATGSRPSRRRSTSGPGRPSSTSPRPTPTTTSWSTPGCRSTRSPRGARPGRRRCSGGPRR